jgi:hypothetical protein
MKNISRDLNFISNGNMELSALQDVKVHEESPMHREERMAEFTGKDRSGAGWLVLLAMCGILLAARGAAAAAPPDRHHIEVQLRLQEKSLSVRDEIVFGSPPDDGSVSIALNPRARILTIQMGSAAIPYTFHSGRVLVSPPSEVKSGALPLTLTYEAVFDDPLPDDPVSFDNPGFGVTGTISSRGAFLLSGAGWYPQVAGRKASVLLEVSAPRGTVAVTAGQLIKHEDREAASVSIWEIDPLVEGMSLSAGPYVVHSRTQGRFPVYTYLFAETAHLSELYLEASAAHIAFYESLFGPYPFPKFVVVENFFPTGYGFPSYTLLGTSVLQLPFIPETSLKHEVAHSWWGNGVLVDPTSGNWCEGLTTYVADYLSQERKSEEDGIAYRRQILQEYAALAGSGEDFPLARFVGRTSPSTRAVGYGKAAFVFHMIRLRIGDDAFWQSLRRIYRERLFKETSWEDFRRVFSETGNWDSRESKAFFDQWIGGAGAPALELQNVRMKQEDGKGEWLVEGSLRQSGGNYRLRLPLQLETVAGIETQTITLDNASAAFSFRSIHRPRRLVADPDAQVFRRLDPEEIPPTVNSIKGARDMTAVLAASSGPSFESTFRLLLHSLNQGDLPILREEKLKPSDLREKDVILFGQPQPATLKSMLPSQPHTLVLSPRGYSYAGLSPEGSGDCLFAVFKDPARQGRLTALFYPISGASPESISAAARKITHYGKFSVLSFAEGANRSKSIWPVALSPLIVTFEETP